MSKKYLRPISITVLIAFLFFPHGIYALPEGEQVVAGSAAFDRSQTDTLNINVATDKMIANYQSFSIAQPEAVNFLQPSSSSVALNRVVGVDPSSILGTLTATGKIFLINPHGILFGQGCRIDTAGMVASTLNITDNNFLAGRYTFYGQGGSVVNQGYIAAPGGYVSLLGSTVQNTGVIEAELGSVVLASGEAITLNLDPQGLISVVVDEATTQNLENKAAAVENTGTITADGGKVILTAQALDGVFDNAINTQGIIEANALNNQEGLIELTANGVISSTGDMSAEGGIIKICTNDALTLGGSYIADSIIFDPTEVNIDTDLYPTGDTTFWAWGDVNVNANVSSSAGFLRFYADAENIDGDKDISHDPGIGDFNQSSGTTISGTDNIEISGVNININGGTIKAIANPIGSVQVDLSADSTINITNNSSILAKYNGTGHAEVDMEAGGSVNIDASKVRAESQSGYDSSKINIESDESITITGSELKAFVEEDGEADIDIDIEEDGSEGREFIIVDSSNLTAQVGGEGKADIGISVASDNDPEEEWFDGDITVRNGSNLLALVEQEAGLEGKDTEIDFEATTITISGSELLSKVIIDPEAVQVLAEARIDLDAYGFQEDNVFVLIDNSTVQSEVIGGEGRASVSIGEDRVGYRFYTVDGYGDFDEYEKYAGGEITIQENSTVKAITDSGYDSAEVNLRALDITVDNSDVIAEVLYDGNAFVNIDATDYIFQHVYNQSREWFYDGGTL